MNIQSIKELNNDNIQSFHSYLDIDNIMLIAIITDELKTTELTSNKTIV